MTEEIKTWLVCDWQYVRGTRTQLLAWLTVGYTPQEEPAEGETAPDVFFVEAGDWQGDVYALD